MPPPPHVLHYRAEDNHRSEVLRLAGYVVEECTSDFELARWFQDGRETDLVCISESRERAAEAALAIAHRFTSAPVVMFRAGHHQYLQRLWNLEVPVLTQPADWLRDVEELLQRTISPRRGIATGRAETAMKPSNIRQQGLG